MSTGMFWNTGSRSRFWAIFVTNRLCKTAKKPLSLKAGACVRTPGSFRQRLDLQQDAERHESMRRGLLQLKVALTVHTLHRRHRTACHYLPQVRCTCNTGRPGCKSHVSCWNLLPLQKSGQTTFSASLRSGRLEQAFRFPGFCWNSSLKERLSVRKHSFSAPNSKVQHQEVLWAITWRSATEGNVL